MRPKKMMKNLILLVFCTFVCSLWVGTSVKAESAEKIQCGTNAYAVLDDLGTLTITGSGEMYDYDDDGNNELYQLRSKVRNIKIDDGITYIGKNAFYHYSALENISIGKGVKIIGECAFSCCSNCKFTEIIIPSNVEEIGIASFLACKYLQKVVFQPGLKRIGVQAFCYCNNLQEVTLPNGMAIVDSLAFGECGNNMKIIIPEKIGEIKAGAFGFWIQSAVSGSKAEVVVYSSNVKLGKSVFMFETSTIRCHRGSTAENYAKQHKNRCEYMGVDSTLYFNANGGKCGVASKKVTSEYCYGELPVATRKGYIFTGWYTKRNGGSKITNGTVITQEKNTTIYAHWTKLSVAKTTIKSLSNKTNGKVTIALKKIPGVKGYEVQYSKDKNMKKAKIKRKSTATITVDSLKKGSTYYVKARAYKIDSQGKRVYGKWSGVKQIRIEK